MTLVELHAPLMPVLAALLHEVPPPVPLRVLDLACGDGDKLLLLRNTWPQSALVGLDHGAAALQRACGLGYNGLLRGDALALPLVDHSCDLVWCCAAFGLFAQPEPALREAWRVLRPGGRLLVVAAEQRWAMQTLWPDDLRCLIIGALPAPWAVPCCDAEIGRDLAACVSAVGFKQTIVRAWPFEQQQLPRHAELSIADWPRLRPQVARQLDATSLARCDAWANTGEPGVVSLLVAALAVRP